MALGCCPIDWLGLLIEAFAPCQAFFLHLIVIVAWAIIRLLLFPMRMQHSPLGRLLFLPTKGIPHTLLLPFLQLTVQKADFSAFTKQQRSRKRPRQSTKPSRTGPACASRPWWTFVFAIFYWTLPVQVFAAPKPWGEAVEIILATTRLLPERLPQPTGMSVRSSGLSGISSESGLFGDQGTPHQAYSYETVEPEQHGNPEPPLQNNFLLPVPPLSDSMPSTGTNQVVQCWCYVLTPHFQAETLSLAIRFPASVEAFCTAARDALQDLRLRYLPLIVPTFPQLESDFASLIVIPLWLHAANKQIIVFDLRAIGGPLYASYTWERVTYGDCAIEASRHNLQDWVVYVQGHTQALQPGESFLAVEGGVIQFQPTGTSSCWRGTLQARLDLPNAWSTDPVVPEHDTEWPIYITFHDQRRLYSQRRYPGESTVACIADMVLRTPDSVLLITPPGRVLENIDYFGTACRDAIAVYPLTPSPDRESIVIFLDPRQVDRPVTHILLAEAEVDPLALVRFLHLHPPPGYKVEVWPRARENGLLLFTEEGRVATFGYVPDVPPDGSDDDASLLSAGSSSDDSDPPPGPPRGPPPAVPYTQLPESLLSAASRHNSPQPADHDRSRSPRQHQAHEDSPCRSSSDPQTRLRIACSHWDLQVKVHRCPQPQHKCKCGHLFLQDLIPHETCVRTSALLANALLPSSLSIFQKGGTPTPSHSQCKLITEIAGDSYRMTPALQTLRRITETLGDTWPYTNQGHPQFQWDEPSDGFSAQDSDEDLVRWVSVLVLKPLYKAEDLTVVLRFPAVEGEVSRTVQDARHYNAKLHFPHLKVAIPQPSDETIVYLAFPASQGLAGVVCIDCTQVDGRLFATELPDYVDRRTILSHADLPPDSSTQVYVGHGRQPLSDDAWIHLFPAITITLLPSEAPPPQFHDISQLLLQGLTWSAISTFVLGTAEGVYCLVTRYSYKLFQVDASQPWRYRQGLADALDVDVQGLRIFPAMPKVHDASVEGRPCSAVLIGVSKSLLGRCDDAFCFTLDCRPLLQGWKSLTSRAMLFPIRLILEEVADGVPLIRLVHYHLRCQP